VSLVSVTSRSVLHTFKTSGNSNPLTQCDIPEDLNVHLVFIKLVCIQNTESQPVTTPALKLGDLLCHHQHFMWEMKFPQ